MALRIRKSLEENSRFSPCEHFRFGFFYLDKRDVFLYFMAFGGGDMARKAKKRYRGKVVQGGAALPFSSTNYSLFGLGVLLIVLGYAALSRGPWDSFWSLTLAPILLVLGYCVVVPFAILYHKKSRQQEAEQK